MSGTPMPQSTEDLIPQLAFLYPELAADGDSVVGLIKPIYVRTNKKELGLPPVDRRIISLHHVCHHAIYLDRTFNAAHYLQSEDRIHRYGLKPDQKTNIEIVECIDSIDETVRNRLNYKIGRMAEALEDTSLHPDPIPLDPTYSSGVGRLYAEDLIVKIEGAAGTMIVSA